MPPEEITFGCRGYFTYLDRYILPSSSEDEEPGSLRVLCTCHDDSWARAAVFSSDTREWQIFPWAHAFTRRRGDDKYWLHSGSLVNGMVYWTHTNKPYMLVLDTLTMRFSRIDLPQYLRGQGHSFRVGETEDGKPCIVGVVVFSLLVWYWRPDDNGVEEWMLDRMFPLQDEVLELTEGSPEEHAALKVIGIIGGYVYLSTFETFNDPDLHSWFVSFCLETGKLEKLFQKKYDCHIHPYIMPWPPALLGYYIPFGFVEGTANCIVIGTDEYGNIVAFKHSMGSSDKTRKDLRSPIEVSDAQVAYPVVIERVIDWWDPMILEASLSCVPCLSRNTGVLMSKVYGIGDTSRVDTS